MLSSGNDGTVIIWGAGGSKVEELHVSGTFLCYICPNMHFDQYSFHVDYNYKYLIKF